MCSWSLDLMFKAKLKLESGNWKIQYGRQAAIVKVTLLKINSLLSIHTGNLLLKFGLDIPETEKSNKATRRPFWKWHGGKSIGFGPWQQTSCVWNLKLKFHSKLELRSRNHSNYRVHILKNPIWPPGEKWHFWKSIDFVPYTQVMCQWSLNMVFKAKVKLESGNRNI